MLLANAPRFRSASIVLITILPQRVAAMSQHVPVARCLIEHPMVQLAPPLLMESASCLPLKQPLVPAREVAYRHSVMQRCQRVRPESNDRFG